jgi:hypothetical protein
MNGIAIWLERQRPLRLGACCARLVGAMLLWAVPVSALAYERFGVNGLWASLVAGVVCLAAGLLALVATAVFRGPNAALWSLAFGLAFRMGLPLGCGLYLSRSQPLLAEAGVFGLIVAYYLFTLVVETLLSLRLTRSLTQSSAPAAGNANSGKS